MKTTQSTLSDGASVLASLGKDSRGGSRGRSPHRCTMLVVLMFVAALARGATNDLSGLLQKGLFEEEANRNLEAATAAYQTLVLQFDKDRQIGATAIFRLGEVYRKQGKTNEAAAQYERIVRDFAEQTTLVTLSRQNLAGLGVTPKSTNGNAPLSVVRKAFEYQIKVGDTLSQIVASFQSAGIEVTAEDVLRANPGLNNAASLRVGRMLLIPASGTEQPAARTLSPEAQELERSEKILAQLQDWDLPQLRRLIPTLVPDAEFERLNEKLTLNEKFGDNPTEQQILTYRTHYRDQLQKRAEEIMVMLKRRVELLREAVAKQNATGSTTAASTITTVADEEEAEIRRIQAMIRNSPDLINAPSGEGGLTPLHTAARQGQLTVARFLLDSGANVNSKNSSAQTPLIMAVSAGHKAMAELLLSKGADVNARTSGGNTPLHIAASSGYGGVAEVLLARKANVSAADNGDRTPLHLAASSGHSALMELLIRNGADANAVDNGGQTALMNASQSGHSLAVEVLLSAKANVNAADKNGATSLIAAAGRGHLVSVKALLAAKADPDVVDQKGRTALSYAAGNGDLDVVKALVDGKADPNAGSLDLPLAMAAHGKRLEVAECLLKANADPNKRGKCSADLSSPETPGFFGGGPGRRFGDGSGGGFGPFLPLQIAVSQRDAGMVALLLKFKADTNIEAPWAPNRSLAGYVLPNPDMLKSFLTAGVDIGATNWESWPLLLLACANANSAAVEMLLAQGANPNIQSRDRHWALELAAKSKCVKCVELLLKAKADVNVRDDLGATPLYWAVDASDKAAVELLLAHGANPNIANHNGATPLARCKSGSTLSDVQMKEIAPLLRQHGALDNLPAFDRIQITRPAVGLAKTIFKKGRIEVSNFTLLDLFGVQYQFLNENPGAGLGKRDSAQLLAMNDFRSDAFSFPDLTKVRLRRPAPDGKNWDDRFVDVAALLRDGDCSQNLELKWGDEIVIPETDHGLGERWNGFSRAGLKTFNKCLARTVEIVVKGQAAKVTIGPKFENLEGNSQLYVTTGASLWLRPVLYGSNLLLASSDLARVKVTRGEPGAGKPREWVLDCSSDKSPEFWLRDGDVIEVPDKP